MTRPWIGCKHKEFVPKANPCAWTTLTVPYVAIPATRFRSDKSSVSVNGHMHMWGDKTERFNFKRK